MEIKRLRTYRLIQVVRVALLGIVLAGISVPAWQFFRRQNQSVRQERPPARLPEDLAIKTEGFSFSRVESGQVVFSVKARTNLGFRNNQNLLEGVEVTIHQNENEPERRIRSDRCDYDEPTGNIRFAGNVRADLSDDVVATTEELQYDHQNRVLRTDAPIQVTRADGLTGNARRLTYPIAGGSIELHGDVAIHTADQMDISAQAVHIDRRNNRIDAQDQVRVETRQGWISSQAATVFTVGELSVPTRVEFQHGVRSEFKNATDSVTWTMEGERLDVEVQDGRIARRAVVQHGAHVRKSLGASAQTLSAERIDATFDESGQVTELDSGTPSRMTLGPDRALDAGRIQINAAGDITTSGESDLKSGDLAVTGRDFRLRQSDPMEFKTGERASIRTGSRVTSADRTEAEIDGQTNQVIRLVQSGRFEFTDAARRGSSDEARIEEGGQVVELRGRAVIVDPGVRLEASRIRLRQPDNSFEASGRVRTVSTGQGDPLLVRSESARGAGKTVHYEHAVELWRGQFFVAASAVDADQDRNDFHAFGDVRSRIDMVRIDAEELHYDGGSRVARYQRTVRARREDTELQSAEMTIHLQDNQVHRIEARGDVTASRPGTIGRGEAATYDVATEVVELTGGNAVVEDQARGVVRGTRVVIERQGSRAAVQGDAPARTTTQYKVQKRPNE